MGHKKFRFAKKIGKKIGKAGFFSFMTIQNFAMVDQK